MKTHYFLTLLSAVIVATPIFGVTIGAPGQTISGDYVVIVNTNADYTQTQATGAFVFDATNSATLTGVAQTPSPVNNTTQLEFTNTLSPETPTVSYSKGDRKD